MCCHLITASAVVAALAFGGPAGAAAAAASDVPQPWAESSSATPSRVAPSPRAKPGPASPHHDGASPPGSGEASSGAVRARRSARSREQVRREARANLRHHRSADGWENIGGEGGTRLRP